MLIVSEADKFVGHGEMPRNHVAQAFYIFSAVFVAKSHTQHSNGISRIYRQCYRTSSWVFATCCRFGSTFFNCSGLTNSIPADLFGSFAGAPASAMFGSTFRGCSNIPGGDVVLSAAIEFTDANVVGPLTSMMRSMTEWEGELYWGTNVIHKVITPASRIFTFEGSTKMPEYDTIDANWK
jgi:hypothetical protein